MFSSKCKAASKCKEMPYRTGEDACADVPGYTVLLDVMSTCRYVFRENSISSCFSWWAALIEQTDWYTMGLKDHIFCLLCSTFTCWAERYEIEARNTQLNLSFFNLPVAKCRFLFGVSNYRREVGSSFESAQRSETEAMQRVNLLSK